MRRRYLSNTDSSAVPRWICLRWRRMQHHVPNQRRLYGRQLLQRKRLCGEEGEWTALHKRHRELEAARKRSYIELYIPHLALGLKDILKLNDKEEGKIVGNLKKMLEKTHLDL